MVTIIFEFNNYYIIDIENLIDLVISILNIDDNTVKLYPFKYMYKFQLDDKTKNIRGDYVWKKIF